MLLQHQVQGQWTQNQLAAFVLTAGASSAQNSDYSYLKKIALKADEFSFSKDHRFKYVEIDSSGFAVFKVGPNRNKAFQILLSMDSVFILCEHYVIENCDCREGLFIIGKEELLPVRVRKLLPFSLKSNLIDSMGLRGVTAMKANHFEGVCEILEYLGQAVD
jgi:hypothetical protein